MKKFLSALISASIFLSFAAIPAFAADETSETSEGIVSGYSESLFGPHSANEQKAHAYEPFKELEEKENKFNHPYAENTVVFKRDEGGIKLFGENDTDKLLNELGAKPEIVRSERNGISLFSADNEITYRAEISEETTVKEAVEKLSEMEDIIYAEPDYLFYTEAAGLPDRTTDPGIQYQWYLESSESVVRTAWGYLSTSGYKYGGLSDTVVAVIDTGVDYTHEDLTNNMWVNLAELNGTPGVDDDGNGYIDDIHGISTVGSKEYHNGDPTDDHGHGTHVAGIIGMTANNGKGGAGVAPGSKIMAIKAGQASGVFSSTDIAEAIDYAAAMGADVINMSFGSYASSSIVEDSLKNAFGSCVLVAAAGNDSYTTQSDEPTPALLKPNPMYPAAYTYVLGVMAHDQLDQKTDFSNWDYKENDSQEYEIIAPGKDIFSTIPGNRYAVWSGTSMAAPIVSGAAALVRAKFSDKRVYSSRFIAGQIAASSDNFITYRDRLGQNHSLTKLSIYDSLYKTPKPHVIYKEHYIFDTKDISEVNDADGVVDAGETVDLAVVLRNQWGKADNVTLTVDAKSAAGIDNPYIEFITDTVEYGAIGTFNEDDNGLIRSESGVITGVKNPIRFKIKENTPNDTMITLNLHTKATNGYDSNDKTEYTNDEYKPPERITFFVQKGRVLKGRISNDMTLTNDDYWIIENSVLIPQGVTVNIEPGTQIQFWSSDGSDPYNDESMAYIKVEGALNVNGTEDKPVEMFPSLAYEQFGCEIFSGEKFEDVFLQSPIGNINMEYVDIINPRLNIEYGSHIRAEQSTTYVYYKQFSDNSYMFVGNMHGSVINCIKLEKSLLRHIRSGSADDTYVNGGFDDILFDNCSITYNNYGRNNSEGFKNSVFLINTANPKENNEYKHSKFAVFGDRAVDTSDFSFSDIVKYNNKKYVKLTVDNYSKFFGHYYNHYFVFYAAEDSDKAYDFADKFSKSRGGYIASVSDDDEMSFLAENFPLAYVGLRRNEDKTISWASGESTDNIITRLDDSELKGHDLENDEEIKWYKWYYIWGNNLHLTENIAFWPKMEFVLEYPDTVSDEEILSKKDIEKYVPLKKMFDNNAVLNRLITADKSKWMTFVAPTGNSCVYDYSNNYWGTADKDIIENQIRDFDDYITLGDVVYEPYLTTPPEDCYPFVTDVSVYNSAGAKVSSAGAEEITVKVSFNRDMAQDTDPTVSMGSDEPWTDFIISGEWTDARTWTGKYKITPMTGDGMMYFRVIGAAAADDKWLVTGDDWGRFGFEVVTSGAEALALQASGSENKIELMWTQDDYDVLAGYNIYRSRSQNGSYTKLNTTLIPADTKEFTDTNVSPGIKYYYKFTVVDTAMNESDYSNVASAAPVDNIKPVIIHTPVTSAALGTDIQIIADITDNIGVTLAELRYRTTGGSWKETEMNIISDSRYLVRIPAGEVTGDMEYYIMATDGTSWSYDGSDAVPYIVSVNNSPVIYSVSPVSTTVSSGTRIYITGTNFQEGIKVYVGETEATDLELTDSENVSAIMPENPVGAYDVKVTNPDGNTAVLPRAFSYLNSGLTLQIQTGRGIAGQSVSVPVSVTDAESIHSADFTFFYDTTLFTLKDIEKSLSAAGFSLEQNDTAGTVKVSMAASEEVKGNIPLVYLNFKINDGAEFTQSVLTLAEARINGINVENLVNGSITSFENYSVSGYASYYNGGTPISGAAVSAAAQKTAVTNESGGYTITGLVPDSYTLVPSKSDEQSGISAYDASLVLKHSVGKILLSGDQLLAADVDGSGEVDAEDASWILKAAVGKISGAFPGSGRVWAFSPSLLNVTVAGGNQSGQNFKGILMGDVSGNWGEENAELFAANDVLTVTMPEGGSEFEVPIYIDTDITGSAVDIKVSFSENVDDAKAVLSDKTADFASDQSFNGETLSIAAAGSGDIAFNGSAAVILKLKTSEPLKIGSSVNVNILSVRIDEKSFPIAKSVVITAADNTDSQTLFPINDYESKLSLSYKNNALTITPNDSDIDLRSFRLYLAEYDDNTITSIKKGKAYKADDIISIICDTPESENYKYFLWDDRQSPVMLPIEKQTK